MNNPEHQHAGDMTLRDFFAAVALQGLLANDSMTAASAVNTPKSAYALAEAMLAERSK